MSCLSRLDLGVSGGQLTATINDAEINRAPIADARVETWNVQIMNASTRAAQRHRHSTLETVSVTSNGVIMRWHVETRRSREGLRHDRGSVRLDRSGAARRCRCILYHWRSRS